MAGVTFPVAVGGDGSTITDDGDVNTGLANGGHRVRFIKALQQLVAICSYTVSRALSGGRYVKAVGGNVDVVLTADECKFQFFEFTGVLTGDINVVVDTTVRAIFVRNATTGGYSLTVKTAAGTGVPIPQGGRVMVECDGTNMVDPMSHTPGDRTVNGNQAVAGNLGIGGASASTAGLYVTNSALTGGTPVAVFADPTFQSTATLGAYGFYSRPRTAAAAWTLPILRSFAAINGIKGAGSTISTNVGFWVDDLAIGDTNYGIQSTVSSGPNKWNIYASGTANNAFAGNVRIGSTVAPTVALDVTGAVNATGVVTSSSAGKGLQLGAGTGESGSYAVLSGSASQKNWCVANNFLASGALQFIQTAAAGGTAIGSTAQLTLDASGHLYGGADNAQTLGTASKRWSTIYAGTGTINTSDGTTKRVRSEFVGAELAAWGAVRWQIFQFLDAIEAKGESARLHAGAIAQEVAAAFAAQGLDASRYALWCRDEIFEEREVFDGMEVVDVPEMETVEVPYERIEIRAGVPTLVKGVETVTSPKSEPRHLVDESGQPVFERVEVVGADGEVTEDFVPLMVQVPVMTTVTRPKTRKERVSLGDRYGLRYDQCLVFEAAYQRARLATAEARITALEAA